VHAMVGGRTIERCFCSLRLLFMPEREGACDVAETNPPA
jgi:hypothetical protein